MGTPTLTHQVVTKCLKVCTPHTSIINEYSSVCDIKNSMPLPLRKHRDKWAHQEAPHLKPARVRGVKSPHDALTASLPKA